MRNWHVCPSRDRDVYGGCVGWHRASNVWLTLVIAALGAVAGDGLSYEVGRYYDKRIRTWQFVSVAMIDRGEQFLQRHGGKRILFARFFAPARPVVPVKRRASLKVAFDLTRPKSRMILILRRSDYLLEDFVHQGSATLWYDALHEEKLLRPWHLFTLATTLSFPSASAISD
ncbi:DedA family protein [Glaciimonas immobilis]|uniref:Uncharacterized protein n=1 Tax=Glaciimonas immobilis TaxID=728004 RepID=A0A840RY80_9BURK|nr:hypothetical protein [Glaciimonas immobilis]KAF3996345.1 hypothetical protein HAV38_19215 [Glaciimonas immobilis]MBB5202182.1 hypothetical protein [Glaciimonas immobilis]